jgi:hypothetical protein
MALLEEELVARDVDLDTLRITIKEDPRIASIRYTSPYNFGSTVYRAQTVIIGLLTARAILRVDPPVDGGIQISIVVVGDKEVGLHVMAVSASSLQAWAEGSLSDEDFVREWTVGVVTKE